MPTNRSVSPGLVIVSAWCWRILLVTATVLGLILLLERFYLPVLPLVFALLLAALLHPVLALMRRLHLPRALATWATLLLAALVLGGIGWFVWQRAASTYPQLIGQVDGLSKQVQDLLSKLPGANNVQLDQLQQDAISWVRKHTSSLASGVITVGTIIGELVTGLVVLIFVTFYFLQEGDRIWSWLVRLCPKPVQPSVRGAGYRAWHVLSGWVVGTAIIALFHGIVIGLFVYFLGVPLAIPLAVLVFIGSFIPIVGAVLFGGLAVLVALLTQGLVPALILVAVLLVENQIEAHLLQPFIVGKAVSLHPVAIVLALTAGGLVAGIVGAVLVIPAVASLNAAWKYLTGIEDLDGNPRGDGPADRMTPEPPHRYAPLPLYASRSGQAASDDTGHQGHHPDGTADTVAATDKPLGRDQNVENAESAHKNSSGLSTGTEQDSVP